MQWSLGVVGASYESLLLSYGVWEWLVPYIIWAQRIVFVCLLLTATVGRRLKLRRKYVHALDHFFNFAAVKLVDHQEEEEEEEVEQQQKDQQPSDSLSGDQDDVVICPESPKGAWESATGDFRFQDPLPYLAAGMRAVVQDCVSQSFTSAELRTWNMLSRNKHQQLLRMSPSLTVFWAFGVVVRYFFLLPMRLLVLVLSLSNLVILCAVVGLLPDSDFKRRLNAWVVCWCFDFVAGSLSVVARFHNKENRPTHGIVVANHTSPIDSMVLATDQCYDMVGQKASGILGVFMAALSRSSTHIWFERTEAKDRRKAFDRLQHHAQNTQLPPILIYPEGTCVNNTAVLQFKKGAFELNCDVYPIAIRFDPRYGDAFWYQDTFLEYVLSMMTSWAIVCDVWYLPPTRRGPSESALAFSQRVKTQIAHRGGFVQLAWDGFVRLHMTKTDVWQQKKTHWRHKQQQEFARHLSLEEEQQQETKKRDVKKDEDQQQEDEQPVEATEATLKQDANKNLIDVGKRQVEEKTQKDEKNRKDKEQHWDSADGAHSHLTVCDKETQTEEHHPYSS